MGAILDALLTHISFMYTGSISMNDVAQHPASKKARHAWRVGRQTRASPCQWGCWRRKERARVGGRRSARMKQAAGGV